jgi:hypothetical protein
LNKTALGDIVDEIHICSAAMLNNSEPPVSQTVLADALGLFREIVKVNEVGGRGFVSFRQGVLDGEEGYKARNHAIARRRMGSETWTPDDIGSGKILDAMVQAIAVPGNNLLAIDDRNGPDTRVQFPLEKALAESRTADMEGFFHAIYADANPPADADLFTLAVDIFGRTYPLIGYFFFLRDIDMFTPLRPKGLQAGLTEVGIDYPLVQQCSWENYAGFLRIVHGLRLMLEETFDDPRLSLIDTHSFLWVLGSWRRTLRTAGTSKHGPSSSYGPAEMAAYEIAGNILSTVSGANGQIVERRVKPKSTSMDRSELEAHVADLIYAQKGLCKLTGLPFDLPPDIADREMMASPDRIDSDLGYEKGNIQIVCWFANRWKGDDSDANFRRLLSRLGAGPAH